MKFSFSNQPAHTLGSLCWVLLFVGSAACSGGTETAANASDKAANDAATTDTTMAAEQPVPPSTALESAAELAAESAAEKAVATTDNIQLAAVTEDAPAAADSAGAPYEVDCSVVEGKRLCLVDKKTYIGWRTYHAFCHVCHAQDAVGSSFAPSLVERLQDIDKARFLDTVANGYTGQIGVMPPWDENPNVSKRYEELYSYLKARADGALLPGRPKRKK